MPVNRHARVVSGASEAPDDLIARREQLRNQGLLPGSRGAVSIRQGPYILFAPAGSEPPPIVRVEPDKRLPAQSSAALRLHVALFRARSDVNAIVQAHPVAALALALFGTTPAACMLPEAYVELQGPLATPERFAAQVLALAAGGSNLLLLGTDGVVALGVTTAAAIDRIELLEHAARVTQLLQRQQPLPIDPARGLAPVTVSRAAAMLACSRCNACPAGQRCRRPGAESASIDAAIDTYLRSGH